MTVIRSSFIVMLMLLAACSKPAPQSPAETDATTEAPAPAPVRNDIPHLPVLLVTGEQLDFHNVEGKTILILFQPDCDHCQREATAIQENIDAFNGYTLYFVSTAPREELMKFATDYKLSPYANVRFGMTTMQGVVTNFGSISAPSLYVFNESHALVKHFNGETPIDEILKAVQ